MGRSLRASEEGQVKAKDVFSRTGWTQEYLAGGAKCSRATVINFFARKPVDKKKFRAICDELVLEWAEVAALEGEEAPKKSQSVDELIEAVRDNIYGSVVEKCGFMRVLDMSQPLGLDDIYTKVNILEKITGRRRLGVDELVERAGLEDFERFSLGGVASQRVPGMEAVNAHSKLMILGKPGAGKTTFLKHLAIQCVEGTFRPDLVPLFITLKDFAEADGQLSLLDYLVELFSRYGVEPDVKVNADVSTALSDDNKAAVELFLTQGKVLVLLDGLDEVRNADTRRVLGQIQAFANQYRKNLFIITCRIAAKEYTFERFTEVEIADFDDKQIKTFATKWFRAKQDLVKAEKFMERLEQDKGIRELATSPILLTLLCLVFEDAGTFPANRSELYKEGLDVLLKKWDVKRNIERDHVYRRLSLKRKEELLSQIAVDTFEEGNYFFKQKEVERQINRYIRNLPGASDEETALQLDSEAVLKAIESQHGLLMERARGIYSFSHLTFHEYFTARRLVASSKADIFKTRLLPYLTEKRWREVFLLTVGMMDDADELLLLLKKTIDKLVADEQDIQKFLNWGKQKSSSVVVSCKPAVVRAFYLSIDPNSNLAFDFDQDFYSAFDLDLDLDYNLDQALTLSLVLAYNSGLRVNLDLKFDLDLVRDSNTVLLQILEVLENELPSFEDTNQFE